MQTNNQQSLVDKYIEQCRQIHFNRVLVEHQQYYAVEGKKWAIIFGQRAGEKLGLKWKKRTWPVVDVVDII